MPDPAASSTSSPICDADLPRVPLPSLEDSCARLRGWCAPLLTKAQRVETDRAVSTFLAGPGPALQAALTAYDDDASSDSWLDEFWRDRYLGRRDPIAINANFFFVLADLPTNQSGQLAMAGELLARTADLASRIRRGAGPAEDGVSNRQLGTLFGTTRIPDHPRDTVRTTETSRHVVVWHRGHAWTLDVLDESGAACSREALIAAMHRIVSETDDDAAHPVGLLTTQARPTWAEDRRRLLTQPGNATALDRIETALWCLALESDDAPTLAQSLDAVCHQMLAGPGRDRWFDKSLTLAVFPDGTIGLNSEHCLLDGSTVLSYLADLYGQRDSPGTQPPGDLEPHRLHFSLDDDVRGRVEQAAAEFARFGSDTAVRHVNLDGLSRERVKQLGCSPDAFFQLCLQIAQVRARGAVGATYESIATRGWRNGRTEAMRVVTPEIVELTERWDEAVDEDRRTTFAAAAAAHVARAKACQAGAAPEQHLWELQRIDARRGLGLLSDDEPTLYDSPGWLVLRDDRLSTSSVGSPHVRSWGFGATTPTCIGVAYALLPDRAYVCLSTLAAVADQMTRLATELQRAVDEVVRLLDSA